MNIYYNIIRYSHIENLKYICTQLIKINNDIHQLSGLLSEQIIQLELTEIEVTSDAEELTVGQAHLNFLINNFISTYRGVKTELFVLVEDVIRENQCLIN